ncbi:FAD:protein FMN transferase [Ferrimicrobium sp.]|uniref:FAD:protein FMN transferase n=1 Tax=Ferrimicrobium sp. TaxID=2926050 RepID=UPI0026071FD5|nr:FAD:protein FMN transferase [Ferrimicrobium sp.]
MLAEIATMGTVFTLSVADQNGAETVDHIEGGWELLVERATTELARIDAVFSTYRSDSEVSRWRRGERGVCSDDLDEVISLCETARDLSDGYFDPWAVPGGFDPSGLVKGWAAERVLGMMVTAGVSEAVVNGGGDIAIHSDTPINVGIRHPHHADRLCGVVQTNTAVATSGLYERGCHVVNPFGGELGAFAATVVGAPLYLADALATAVIAGGMRVLERIGQEGSFRGLLITHDETMHALPGTVLSLADLQGSQGLPEGSLN